MIMYDLWHLWHQHPQLEKNLSIPQSSACRFRGFHASISSIKTGLLAQLAKGQSALECGTRWNMEHPPQLEPSCHYEQKMEFQCCLPSGRIVCVERFSEVVVRTETGENETCGLSHPDAWEIPSIWEEIPEHSNIAVHACPWPKRLLRTYPWWIPSLPSDPSILSTSFYIYLQSISMLHSICRAPTIARNRFLMVSSILGGIFTSLRTGLMIGSAQWLCQSAKPQGFQLKSCGAMIFAIFRRSCISSSSWTSSVSEAWLVAGWLWGFMRIPCLLQRAYINTTKASYHNNIQ